MMIHEERNKIVFFVVVSRIFMQLTLGPPLAVEKGIVEIQTDIIMLQTRRLKESNITSYSYLVYSGILSRVRQKYMAITIVIDCVLKRPRLSTTFFFFLLYSRYNDRKSGSLQCCTKTFLLCRIFFHILSVIHLLFGQSHR